MQVNYLGMTMFRVFVNVWFAASVVIQVASSIVFWFWLRRRGVRLVYGLAGIPGYLERAYLGWCRSQGRSGTTVIVLRAMSVINVIVAAVVAAMLLGEK